MTKPRVLVFSTIMPLPVSRGDSLRLFYTLKHLSAFAQVRLVCLVRDWEPPVSDLGPLEGIEFYPIPVCKREVLAPILQAVVTRKPSVVYRFDTPRIADAVQRQIAAFQPDIYWGFQFDAYPFARFASRSKRVLDLVDSLSMHYGMVNAQKDASLRARLASLAQPGLIAQERQALAESDLTLVSSPPNEDYLRETHGTTGSIRVFLNAVPDAFSKRRWAPGQNTSPHLLFVGYLGYPPNEAAVRAVIANVLPRVRAQIPDAQFIVCGGGDAGLRHDFTSRPGITFKGYVDDLVSEYADADVSVVPVPYATGVQNKLLEALAVGLPSVLSEVSLRANGVTAGVHVLAADTDAAMAEAVVSLLRDPELARRLSDNGRVFIAARHSWEAQRVQVGQILQSLLPESAVANG